MNLHMSEHIAHPRSPRAMGRQFNGTRQGGQIFVVLAISLVLLIGIVGLAVDSGLGYLIKAKLNAATDAAAVAGARAASQGLTQSAQRAQAVDAAKKFFLANYPAGYLGSNRSLRGIEVRFDDPLPGRITVDVAARATVPVSFSRMLGFEQLDIEAASQTVRKDLDMAFVMDTSGSMAPVAAAVRTQSAAFLDKFNPSTDRIALIHFSVGAEVDEPIRTGQQRGFDRQRMVSDINGFRFSSVTNSAEGMWNARDQLNRIAVANRSSLRVIVFFSDGSPNTFASFFKFRNPSQCALAGSISTSDSLTPGLPGGLWDPAKQEASLPGGCTQGNAITSSLTTSALPDWYNAHGVNDREFPVVTNSPRLVQNDTSSPQATFINVNHASKNVVEAMAAKARAEGIHIFTLGLGPLLRTVTGPSSAPDDTGENLLKCMANTPDAPLRCQAAGAAQPVGVYCHAETAANLQPCFSSLAAEILRITR